MSASKAITGRSTVTQRFLMFDIPLSVRIFLEERNFPRAMIKKTGMIVCKIVMLQLYYQKALYNEGGLQKYLYFIFFKIS